MTMKFWTVAVVLGGFTDASLDGNFVQRLWNSKKFQDTRRNLKPAFINTGGEDQQQDLTFLQDPRRLQSQLQEACDQSFLSCLPVSNCVACFGALQTEGIDWATVTPETPCHEVTDFLFEGGHCANMKGDNPAIDAFCKTFDACVVWYEEEGGDTPDGPGGNETNNVLDCSTLTDCNWDGFHHGWIGDGICHENYPGCYNTEICGYDGGDCCDDTCVDTTSFAECGHDGFACRDPDSKSCDPSLTTGCTDEHGNTIDPDSDEPDPSSVTCASSETMYRLVMFDSFGDGWDSTTLAITPNDDPSKVIYKGGLLNGAKGVEFICLSSSPACYSIKVGGGVWGNEVSWEIRPLSEGAKTLADGGSPMDCTFSVAGVTCDRTCSGKPNVDPTDDPDYKTYKELYACIQKKCLIQVGTCMGSPSCQPCFDQNAPEYCFADDNFNAVIDCGLCQCTDNYSEFCDKKQSPGGGGPITPKPKPDEQPAQKACTAAETLQGSNAVLTFSKCSNFDQVGVMVTNFDENNFGALDKFEACAHSYKNDPGHGGRYASECMKILVNAIVYPSTDPNTDAPIEAISELANLLYHNAEDFCECAATASAECPLCPSFMRFKTLLYESLDACKSLDEIDCDAWNEFYNPCKDNMNAKFAKVDFRSSEQCDFVKAGCESDIMFPAFRRLDCGREIPKGAWDFYNLYARECLQGDDGIPPTLVPADPATSPTPAPTSSSTSKQSEQPSPDNPDVTPKDNNKPYDTGGDGGDGPKPYYSTDDDSVAPYNPSGSSGGGSSGRKKEGSSHFWRNIFILAALAGACVLYVKKKGDSFSFVRYRRAPTRNFGEGSENMFNGMNLENSGVSFEPPSLPPPPSAVDYQAPHI